MKSGVRTNGGVVGKTTAATRGKESDKTSSSPQARGKRGSLVAATQVYGGPAKAPVLNGSASKSGGMQMRSTGTARPAAVDVGKQLLKVPSRSATCCPARSTHSLWRRARGCPPPSAPQPLSGSNQHMAHFVASNLQIKSSFKGKSGTAVTQPVESAGLVVPPQLPPRCGLLWGGRSPGSTRAKEPRRADSVGR